MSQSPLFTFSKHKAYPCGKCFEKVQRHKKFDICCVADH